jgi:hypothetical protein
MPDSEVLWSTTRVTMLVTWSALFPPGFGSGLNLIGVIMCPFSDCAASLVRMPSRELSLRKGDGVCEHDGDKGKHRLT